VKISRWMLVAGAAAIVAAAALSASFGVSKAPAAAKATYGVALISDVAGFNDNGFNKLQLAGLNRAKAQLGIAAFPIVSHSSSDYQPNYNTAIVADHAKLVIAAGFLLGDTMYKYAKANPGIKFAITDDSVQGLPFVKPPGWHVLPNEEGITYSTEQGGCLVGVLAAKMAQKMNGGKAGKIGVAGGLAIPPVDSYIAGFKYCANRAVNGTKTLVQYSNDFVDQTKCSTIAQNEINQGAQVIFQVAGLCGDGALKEAAKLHKWGIGVDADEYNVAPGHILTSALKKTDVGVYNTIKGAVTKTFQGGKDLLFNLKNNGVGVGKISPAVQTAWKNLMLQYKQQMINGTLKPPTACSGGHC
jgi:basic membrane protein A and related proteins